MLTTLIYGMFGTIDFMGNEGGRAINGRCFNMYLRTLGEIFRYESVEDEKNNYILVHYRGGNMVWVNEDGEVFMLGIKGQGLLIIADRVKEINVHIMCLMAQAHKVLFGDALIITTTEQLGFNDPQIFEEYQNVCEEYIWKKIEKYDGTDTIDGLLRYIFSGGKRPKR